MALRIAPYPHSACGLDRLLKQLLEEYVLTAHETRVTCFVEFLAGHFAPINPVAVLVCKLSDEFSLGPPVAFSKWVYSVQRAENLCPSVRECFLIHTTKMLFLR